ncbi:MAG: histidine kinase, partial [Acidobacteria bacterium]
MARTTRPLDGVASIKVKIGLLVALSILAAAVVLQVGARAGVPAWLTLPVTLAAALGVTQLFARGMTAPLRQMTGAAGRMAAGDYSVRVAATSADEVGTLGRAFNRMAGDLADADQQRRQLLATVSHELRTPLAAQRALLENLVDGVVRPDDAALQSALAQSERLSSLVGDLLDVSRVDGGAVPLQLAEVDVRVLLDAAVAETGVDGTGLGGAGGAGTGAGGTGGTGTGRGVRVETEVEPADLVVTGDPARLAQVVANLLDNAVRHSPAGGTVRVRAGLVSDDRWSLEVADEGAGIAPELAERVLTRYGVGDDASGGTGLGLAIASWVCQLHGGTLEVLPPDRDRPGARVRALLPVTPRPATTPDTRPASRPDARPERALHTPTKETTVTTAQPAPSLPPTDDLPGGTVVDALFGRLWPERADRLRTAPLPLAASVAVGALAAAVLPYRNLGIGTALVLLAAGLLVLTLSVHRRRAWTVLSAALCVGLCAMVALRAAEWVAVVSVLAAAALVTTALTDARRLTAVLAGGVAWVLSGIRGLPLLGRTLSAASRHPVLWPVVRTAAISLVALVVFGGLFASGDAVFGSWARQVLPDVHLADSLVLRAFVWFFVGGVVLAACYLALNPPRVDRLALPEARPVARTWEWLVPVGVVLAVFVVFMVAQASAMWGGHEFVLRTTGMSYADYVHQGMGQLTVATALTLVTVALAVRKAPQATAAQRVLLRVVLGALCLLTLVVVASALFRMAVYQQAFGFTVLRVLADVFELWLGLVVVMVMVAGVRLSGAWLPRAALATGAAMVLLV